MNPIELAARWIVLVCAPVAALFVLGLAVTESLPWLR